VEQFDHKLLFHWLTGLNMNDAICKHAVFFENWKCLLNAEIAQRFFTEVNKQANNFMSDEYFKVNRTLIQA
jgi:hypothetical protein